MVGHALAQQDDLLSMRMTLMTLSGLFMPLFMSVTEILLAHRMTPEEVRDPASPCAFAFGQYILLRREAYLATGGYAAADMHMTPVEDLALAIRFKQCRQRIELVNGRGLITNRQWTTWKSFRQGWERGCYSELIRSGIPLVSLPASLALMAYGLVPLAVLLYALYAGKVRRFSTLLAGIVLLAQVDAKRCFDREYELAFPWSLAAPVGWVTCGILLLDVARLILTGRGTDWKGRQLVLFPGVSHIVEGQHLRHLPGCLSDECRTGHGRCLRGERGSVCNHQSL
jgi:chlorobactene glucosyltransferase